VDVLLNSLHQNSGISKNYGLNIIYHVPLEFGGDDQIYCGFTHEIFNISNNSKGYINNVHVMVQHHIICDICFAT